MRERIEEELKRALNRTEPPEGFADRVMARVPERQTTVAIRWWYAAVAAIVALIMVLTTQQIEQRRQRQARETERQVVFALALVAEKLDHVNAKLQNSAPDVRVQQKQEKRYE
jgi:G3E family GTPase